MSLLRTLGAAALTLTMGAASAADRLPASGSLADFITNTTVLSSVEKTARVQLGFYNHGVTKATANLVKAAGTLVNPASLPREITIPAVLRPAELAAARVDYVSSGNVVFTNTYWVWNPETNLYYWKRMGGTETADAVSDKVQPKLTAIVDNGDGTLTATFGFTGANRPEYPIYSKINNLNLPGGATLIGTLPTDFRAAANAAAFSVTFPINKTVKWNLAGIVVKASKADLPPQSNG